MPTVTTDIHIADADSIKIVFYNEGRVFIQFGDGTENFLRVRLSQKAFERFSEKLSGPEKPNSGEQAISLLRRTRGVGVIS